MERIASIVSNSLYDKGYDVSIVTIHYCDNPFYKINNEIKIYNLFLKDEVNSSKNKLKTIFKLRDFLKFNDINILINVGTILEIFSILALIGLDVRNYCWEHFNFSIGRGVKIVRKISRIFCDKIIVLTNQDRDMWIKNTMGKSCIEVICNPSSFEKTSNIPDFYNKRILAIGRLTKQKGFDLLIKAWALICDQLNGWTISIVGSGEEYGSLINLINFYKVSSSINIYPPTKDIIDFYEKSSIYCMSSRFEGYPLVLLEALSFNLPAISFDCLCGPREIIKNNETGALVESENIKKLSEAILKLCSNKHLYDKFCKNLTKDNSFSINESIKKWMNILDN